MKNHVYDLGMDDPVKDSASRYVVELEISPYLPTLTLALSVRFTLWERKRSSVVGVWAASGRLYPTKVKLVIPETVGHNFLIRVLNAKLRLSGWDSARQYQLAGQ